MQLKAQANSAKPVLASKKRQNRRIRTGILFMLPALLVTCIFMLGPAVWSLYISLTNMSLTGVGAATPQWVGFQNFQQIFRDGEFLNALRVSITYLVFSALIGQALLGLLLALLMRKRNPVFKAILGGIVVVAWVIPDVVAVFFSRSLLSRGAHRLPSPR